MTNKCSGKWVWRYRDNEKLMPPDWYEETRKHSMLTIEEVKKRMRKMGCRHVAGKMGDTTFVFECPDE